MYWTKETTGIVHACGENVIPFLQGLTTALITEGQTVYSFFLNHRGRYLFDAILVPSCDGVHIYSKNATHLLTHLNLYRLRNPITFTLTAEADLFRIWGGTPTTTLYQDPRFHEIPSYVSDAIPQDGIPKTPEDWRTECLHYCIPQTHHFIFEESLILEYNAQYLGAISTTKGCYLGQETTARMLHRTAPRYRLAGFLREDSSLPPPPPGTELKNISDGSSIGRVLDACHNVLLASVQVPPMISGVRQVYVQDTVYSLLYAPFCPTSSSQK